MSDRPHHSPLPRLLMWLGFVFLYAPILILVVYSFNESRLVTVWGGLSTRWYVELVQDEQLMAAAWRSLKIAFLSASAAIVLGTMAGIALVRFHRFRGRTLFSGMLTAPLVMPDVIIGLSLLLLFVNMSKWIGWPEYRGMLTIWIAHVTFCTAYVAVVVSSRLKDFDLSLEEAAMDLGANRLQTFVLITLPIISPALIAGWLLAFTLSLDDLVIASFVSGPSSTTLPMQVFSSVRLGVTPKINALATILIAVVSLGALVAWWVVRLEDRRQRRDRQLAARV
jgi:putrescine transport system permease protein